MTDTHANTTLIFEEKDLLYRCEGSWSILHVNQLLSQFNQLVLPKKKSITINGSGITYFDSAAALLLKECVSKLEHYENKVNFVGFNEHQHDLIKLVEEKHKILHYKSHLPKGRSLVYKIGKEAINKIHQIDGLIILIGSLSDKLFAAFAEWRRFQFPSIVSNINSTGLTALPIVGLLSFLIGVVLAYQMGLQLETYGANIFIAYLSGMAIFREFAPLITAVIIAGRTSSSFTAQIGSMKINEEIDALYTMGLSPVELIVVPKVLGMLLIFPLLIFWSDVFSTAGAMFMSKLMLHVNYSEFLSRLQESVGLKQMMLGLYKAPAFAILIALVGCFQGFQVKASADSVGTQTTKSVVQALFLIIIADAIYSVIYSWLDL